MKILFFVIVIANLVLFLWEYRSGAFVRSEIVVVENQEKILLIGEEKKGLRGNTE